MKNQRYIYVLMTFLFLWSTHAPSFLHYFINCLTFLYPGVTLLSFIFKNLSLLIVWMHLTQLSGQGCLFARLQAKLFFFNLPFFLNGAKLFFLESNSEHDKLWYKTPIQGLPAYLKQQETLRTQLNLNLREH